MVKYAIISNEDTPHWRGSEELIKPLVTPAAHQEGAPCDVEFVIFNAFADELPLLEDAYLSQFAGIVVLGSKHSCYDDTIPWLPRLRAFIRSLVVDFLLPAEEKGLHHLPRLMGICFGHQIIAHSLPGGLSGPNVFPAGVRHFELGATKTELLDSFFSQPWVRKAIAEDPIASASSADFLRYVSICTSHGDAVLQLPDGAKVLATSPSTEFEMYSIGKSVFALQNHPELTPAHIIGLILPNLLKNGKMNKETAQSVVAASILAHNPDNNPCTLCRDLLSTGPIGFPKTVEEINASPSSSDLPFVPHCPDPQRHSFLTACFVNFFLRRYAE